MNSGEKVVVIGGSGFLGSHLADCLSDQGFAVTIYDLNVSPWLRKDQHMVCGDVLEFEKIQDVVRGSAYVYHLAGVADIGQAAANPRTTIERNILGSTNVTEACVAAKVRRLLFASTVYVYSDKGSFYRVSKQAVESIIEAYGAEYGLEYTVLRYGSLYGPRAQVWNGLKRWVSQAVQGQRILYPGTGEERREYIHVLDAVRLSVEALRPEFANQHLTLTGTQVLSIREVLTMIQEISSRRIEMDFTTEGSDYSMSHYALTPYRYTPRQGKKMVPSVFIDLGQGILDLIEEIHHETAGEAEHD